MWGQLDVLIILIFLVLLNRFLSKIGDWEYFFWGIVFAILLNFKVHVFIYLPIIFYLLINKDFNINLIKKNILIWSLFIVLISLIILFDFINFQALSVVIYILTIALIIYLHKFKNKFTKFSSGLFIGLMSILNIFLNINFTLYTNNILGFMTKEDVVSMYAANLWLIFGFLSEMPTSEAFVFGINVKYMFYFINLVILCLLGYFLYKLYRTELLKKQHIVIFVYFLYLLFFLYTSTKMHSRYLIYALIPMTIFFFALYKNTRLINKFTFGFMVLIIFTIHVLFFLNQLYVFFDNYSYENTKFLESLNVFRLEEISLVLLIAICGLIYLVLSYIKDNYLIYKNMKDL